MRGSLAHQSPQPHSISIVLQIKPDMQFQSLHVGGGAWEIHPINAEKACLELIGCIRHTAWKGRPPVEVG